MKAVKLSWRDLAGELMGWRDYRSDGRKKLDAIECQHISDEACLKAVVEAFLLGEGRYQPSWRRLIHQLHKAEETSIAEKIKTNAELQRGERVYFDESLSSVHVCGRQSESMYVPLTC